jgi:plastocyanin
MNRRVIVLGAIAVLVSLVLSSAQATNGENQTTGRNYEVRMKDSKFDQKEIEIKVGDTVSWVNDDDMKHSVTTVTGSEISIAEIIVEANEHSARTKFDTAGTFKYKCKFHSGMTGTIKVIQ